MTYQLTADTFAGLTLLANEPLAKYTHTKTGGPADWLVFPETVAQVQAIVTYVCHYPRGAG